MTVEWIVRRVRGDLLPGSICVDILSERGRRRPLYDARSFQAAWGCLCVAPYLRCHLILTHNSPQLLHSRKPTSTVLYYG